MKREKMRAYLRPFRAYGRVSTSITRALAGAIAPVESYDDTRVAEALLLLGQDPDGDLACVYCGNPAGTWDHVFGLVADGHFSGYGHVLGNLVPCCSTCNSRKNRHWRDFVIGQHSNSDEAAAIIERIERYLAEYGGPPLTDEVLRSRHPAEMAELDDIKSQIFDLLHRADDVATIIRDEESMFRSGPVPRGRRRVARGGRPRREPKVAPEEYERFHRAAVEHLTIAGSRPRPASRSWQVVRSGGFGGFWIWVVRDAVRVVAYLDTTFRDVDKTPFNKAVFDRLFDQRTDIEAAFGDELMWERLNDRGACWIGVQLARPDLSDPDAAEKTARWAAEYLDRLVPAIEDRAVAAARELRANFPKRTATP